MPVKADVSDYEADWPKLLRVGGHSISVLYVYFWPKAADPLKETFDSRFCK